VLLTQLETFRRVASLRSFTRAAAEVHLTQPAVSKHIRDLEEHYGTRLLERFGKRTALTHAGEILLAEATHVLELLEQTKARIHDLERAGRGRLRIGASFTIGTYLLPELLAGFRRQFPDIVLSVEIDLSQRIVEAVLANAVDIGLIGHHAQDPGLIETRLLTDELVLIVRPEHPWAGRRRVPPQDLATQLVLLGKEGSGTRTFLEAQLRQQGIVLDRTLEFGNTEGVKKAVEAGLGVSILSGRVVAQEVARGTLRVSRLTGMELKRDYYSIVRRDKYLTKAARAFLGASASMGAKRKSAPR
jgi:DNA-binding transcriptional LysR family regulator